MKMNFFLFHIVAYYLCQIFASFHKDSSPKTPLSPSVFLSFMSEQKRGAFYCVFFLIIRCIVLLSSISYVHFHIYFFGSMKFRQWHYKTPSPSRSCQILNYKRVDENGIYVMFMYLNIFNLVQNKQLFLVEITRSVKYVYIFFPFSTSYDILVESKHVVFCIHFSSLHITFRGVNHFSIKWKNFPNDWSNNLLLIRIYNYCLLSGNVVSNFSKIQTHLCGYHRCCNGIDIINYSLQTCFDADFMFFFYFKRHHIDRYR